MMQVIKIFIVKPLSATTNYGINRILLKIKRTVFTNYQTNKIKFNSSTEYVYNRSICCQKIKQRTNLSFK